MQRMAGPYGWETVAAETPENIMRHMRFHPTAHTDTDHRKARARKRERSVIRPAFTACGECISLARCVGGSYGERHSLECVTWAGSTDGDKAVGCVPASRVAVFVHAHGGVAYQDEIIVERRPYGYGARDRVRARLHCFGGEGADGGCC